MRGFGEVTWRVREPGGETRQKWGSGNCAPSGVQGQWELCPQWGPGAEPLIRGPGGPIS